MNGSLALKLNALVVRVGALLKDQTGTVTKGGQTAYTYTYLSWAGLISVCAPLMQELRIGWWFRSFVEGGVLMIELTLTDLDSREFNTGVWPAGPINASSQALGSGSAYAKRYLFLTMTGLATSDGDDDGAAASKPTRTRKPKDSRPMHERIIGALDACDRPELVDKLMQQKSTTDVMAGLNEMERTLIENAAAARKRALEVGPGTQTADAPRKPLLTSARLAIIAGDEFYPKFVEQVHGITISTLDEAAAFQRDLFKVGSRSEIDGSTVLDPIARSHIDEFLLWKNPP